MSSERGAILAAFLDAKWKALTLRSREQIVRRQASLWRDMGPVVLRTPAVARLAGRPLDGFPIVTPQQIRAEFARWNTRDISLGEARMSAGASEEGLPSRLPAGIAAGFSTGTSGHRGVFLSNPKERARYIGHALARLVPAKMLMSGVRLALCLRAGNQLYDDVAKASRTAFCFVGLDTPPAERRQRLEGFHPDVLIAPSHVLADLASAGSTLRPKRVFYGAESMGEEERTWIAGELGVRPDPIYQATEGFLGHACAHGTLHLNEDVLVVEEGPSPLPGSFTPIVTDLRRTTQPMIRVQLDDLLEPLDQPCSCGSPLRAIRGVAGRVSDIWRWGETLIGPRAVMNAVAQALPSGAPWTATGTPTEVILQIDPRHEPDARAALEQLLAAHGVDLTIRRIDPAPKPPVKRRQVQWRDG